MYDSLLVSCEYDYKKNQQVIKKKKPANSQNKNITFKLIEHMNDNKHAEKAKRLTKI